MKSESTAAASNTPDVGHMPHASHTTDASDINIVHGIVPPEIREQLLNAAWGHQALQWKTNPDKWPALMADALCINGQFRQHIMGGQWGDIQLARQQIETPCSGTDKPDHHDWPSCADTRKPNAQLLKSCYDRGFSIIANNLQQRSSLIASVCAQLQQSFSCGCNANAYLTPPQAQALQRHYDDEDVIIMQLSGSKQWQVWLPGQVDTLPLEGLAYSPECAMGGELLLDTTLTPGDCLYLPAGHAHAARTSGKASLHITFSLAALCMADLIIPLLRLRMFNLQHGQFLRKRVPLDWLDPLGRQARGVALFGLRSGFITMAHSLSESELERLFMSLTDFNNDSEESSAPCPT